VEFRKLSVDEMDALRQEKSRLRRKEEAETTNVRGKDREAPDHSKNHQHVKTSHTTKEESE